MEITKKILLLLLIAFALVMLCQAAKTKNAKSAKKSKVASGSGSTEVEDVDDAEPPTVPIIDPSDLLPEEAYRCRGRWTRWTQWSDCVGPCNGRRGHQFKERNCTRTSDCFSNEEPRCNGRCYKSRRCRLNNNNRRCGNNNLEDPCTSGSRQGEWSEWGCWSQTCDMQGERTRYRWCNKVVPVGPGMGCRGRSEETEACQRVEPSTPTPCVAAQDITFAVDASGSIGTSNFNTVTTSLLNVIQRFDLETPTDGGSRKVRVGIITFSNTAFVEKALNDFNLPSGFQYAASNTNTHLAIDKAQEMFTLDMGDRPQNPNVLVVLTDGKSTNPTETLNAAERAKAAGIKVIALGIGNNFNRDELEKMVTDSSTDVYEVRDFDALGQELANLFVCA